MNLLEEERCTSPRRGQARGIVAIVDFVRQVNQDRRHHRTTRLARRRRRDRLDVKGRLIDDGGRFAILHWCDESM
jgi:hypothetical protein